ncbi:potassium channel protein [candidate division KSB1 bacterium]|nr:potassium channel protein [candidate division KSB1 bacterium]RQW03133.1 MAG: potassium channel protein [candidate division KSB1 bacterium]
MALFLQIYKRLFNNRLLKFRGVRVILFAVTLNIMFGVLFYLLERDVQEGLTLLDSLWWAMVTMTTVGYGDFYAQTPLGRFLISYACMLVGIGIIGYLVGGFAENMLEHVSKKKRGLMQIKSTDHIIICNYPHLEKIRRLVDEIRHSYRYRNNDIVLITDMIEELPQELRELDIKFVHGDPVREDVLLRANINKSVGVFILARDPGSPTSDEKTFAIGTIIELIEREINKPIRTVAEVVNKDNIRMMQRSRVDGVVSSDGIMDGLIVQEFLNPGVHDIVQQILTNAVGCQFYIMETKLHGRPISELQIAMLNHPTNVQLIGLSRGGKNILSPPKDMILEKDDRLIVLAEHRQDFEKVEEDILASSAKKN